jgi:hypothetical protein
MEKFAIKNIRSTLLRASIIAVCCVSVLEVFPTSSTQAAPGGECKSLTVEQSEDKNYHIFTVTGSGPDIKGYSIDFGDQQSYTFDFQKSPTNDRGTAKVRHTYQKEGRFTATAKIITSAISESSPTCVVHVTIGQPTPTELPTTGSEDSVIVLTALLLGVVTYEVVLFWQPRFSVYTPRP